MDEGEGSSASVLIRAKSGAAEKISTVVELDYFTDFFQSYAEVCKGQIVGLKKRDRKKTKKNKKKTTSSGHT